MLGGVFVDGIWFNFLFSGGNYDRVMKMGNFNFFGGVYFMGVYGFFDLLLSDLFFFLKNGKGVMKFILNVGGMVFFKGRVDFVNVFVVLFGFGFIVMFVVLIGNGV